MQRRFIILAAVAVFLITLIVELPVQWLHSALPRGVRCRELEGSLWSGSCADLTYEATPLGDLSWRVHPLALLSGKLAVDLSLQPAPGSEVHGGLELHLGGRIDAHDVAGSLALDRAHLPQGAAASADLAIDVLSWNGRRLTALAGRIDLHGLRSGATPLGDYRLSFPPSQADEPVGRIQDLGGPFEAQGTLRLTRAPGYQLDVLVLPRAGAPPDAVQALRVLGAADAQGRRPLSMEGTF